MNLLLLWFPSVTIKVLKQQRRQANKQTTGADKKGIRGKRMTCNKRARKGASKTILPFLKGCYCLNCFIASRRVMVREKYVCFEDFFLGSHLPSKSVSS